MMRGARTGVAVLAALAGMPGCIDVVDASWFDPERVDAYELPHNEVPDALLEIVELTGTAVDGEAEAPMLYGAWARACDAQSGVSCPIPPSPRNRVTVLYLHGNAGNLDRYWDRVQILWRLGFSVFAIDYRGYGRSTGEPSEAGLYADARTALGHVAERTGGPVVYYGWSLGSTAAVQLATEHEPAALVLEAPLASGQAFVDDALGLGIPHRTVMDTEFDNLGKIPDVAAPKLIVHGTEDTFVRIEFGRALYREAVEPKQMVEVPGAVHGNVPCPSRDTAISPVDDPCVATTHYNGVVGGFVFEHAVR